MASCSDITDLRRARALLGTGCPGPAGPAGPQGPAGATGASGSSILRGNVLVVDSVYGNDSTASVGGSAWLTVEAAVAASSSGQTVWIMPGTYTLASGITLKDGTAMRGLNTQTVILQMNVTSSTTMITMGENCRLEDCTINLTCTGSTNNVILKGILFGGTSSQTAKIRTTVISVRNSAMSSSLTSTVYAIQASGTGALNASVFSFNSIKGSTINVYSNGQGNKRCLIVTGSNQISLRDVNLYMAQPTNTASTGSYVGIETADSGNTGSAQLRTTTVGCVKPTSGQGYTASDILQTNPTTITDPTFLASSGIQVGPGVDLVTKTAGGKGFSVYIYPLMMYYGIKGNILTASNGAWMWPGTQEVKNNTFPDPDTEAAYFRIQQPALLCGFNLFARIAPSSTNSVTALIQHTPVSTGIRVDTSFTVTISGTTKFATFYNASLSLATGDFIHVYLSYVNLGGASPNLAHDITVQVDLF
jgi:hypothetical protein